MSGVACPARATLIPGILPPRVHLATELLELYLVSAGVGVFLSFYISFTLVIACSSFGFASCGCTFLPSSPQPPGLSCSLLQALVEAFSTLLTNCQKHSNASCSLKNCSLLILLNLFTDPQIIHHFLVLILKLSSFVVLTRTASSYCCCCVPGVPCGLVSASSANWNSSHLLLAAAADPYPLLLLLGFLLLVDLLLLLGLLTLLLLGIFHLPLPLRHPASNCPVPFGNL